MKAYLDNFNFYLPMRQGSKYIVYFRIDMRDEPCLIVSRADLKGSYYETVFSERNEVEFHKVLKLILDTIFNLDGHKAAYHLKRLYELYGKMGDND